MEGVGERKRKGGLELDFDNLIGRDNDPPPELVIQQTAEGTKDSEPEVDNYIKNLTDKDLREKISRGKTFVLKCTLPDGGEKMSIKLKAMEAELERRNRQKEIDKCKEVTVLDDDSTCNGPTKNLSHPGAPPSKPASEFGVLFCSNLDKERATQPFREEISTLNRCSHKRIRENRPFSTPTAQKKDLSSRQTPFKSPCHLSINIDNQQKTRIHASNPSPHPSNRDSTCCSTKKETGARSQPPFNSMRNNRRTYVLVDEEEFVEVDVANEADLVSQSSKDTRIYYPSSNDPEAIEICFSDIECLAPETYLSSPIMNFYIRYLQKPSPSAIRKHNYHIFNTFFYEKLKQDVLTKSDTEASFRKFRRWWKGVNISEKAYILLPIHESVHWSLVIICIPHKEDDSAPFILHLDSLGLHTSSSIFKNVKSFLVEEWLFLKKQELPELPITRNYKSSFCRKVDEKVIQVPQQKNDYDCGVFVLFFMERFIKEAPERLEKQNLENMFGRQWFKPEEASSLRRKIRNLLEEEFKSASEDTCILDS